VGTVWRCILSAKPAAKLPAATRRELQSRINQSETTLREHRVKPSIWRRLVPFVRWTRSSARIDLPGFVEQALVRDLGERYKPLSEPVDHPTPKELRAETARLMAEEGIDRETALTAADATLLQRRLEEQGYAPRLMREPLAWEAATSAAIAAGALENPTPQVLSPTRQYFERLDDARRFDEVLEKVRGPRVKGGRAAARQRASEHREKVAELQTEYRQRLKARQEGPAIIRDMARRYGYTVPYLRRLIRPRALKNLRGR
jgi:hypothetical protein